MKVVRGFGGLRFVSKHTQDQEEVYRMIMVEWVQYFGVGYTPDSVRKFLRNFPAGAAQLDPAPVRKFLGDFPTGVQQKV